MTAPLLSMEKQVSVIVVLPPAVCYVHLGMILTLSASHSILIVRKKQPKTSLDPVLFQVLFAGVSSAKLQTWLRPSAMRADSGAGAAMGF